MLTAIEDGEDPKTAADRKRWIGAGYPCFSLDRDDDRDGDHNEWVAIEEWVLSGVTME